MEEIIDKNLYPGKVSDLFDHINMPPISHLFKYGKFLIVPTVSVIDDKKRTDSLHQKLCQTKSALDKYYVLIDKNRNFPQILNLLDPFRTYKYKIAQQSRAQNTSNAWLKFWELISEFKLIPNLMANESFVTFDNAALPGSGILAINHYIKTNTRIKSHVWYASSLIENNTQALNDSYSLVKNYPTKWLMNCKNNGDVTKLSNLENISIQLTDKVHLYTSDLGFDVSDDYNNQESQHAHCNLGQFLLGFYVLKKGGNMIVKMYTFFTDFTQSMLFYCSKYFSKFYITKPITSRITNSECYIIGVDFLGLPEDINLLETRLENFSLDPLVLPCNYSSIFLDSLEAIYQTQINALVEVIELYEKIKEEEFELIVKKLKSQAKDIHNTILSKWRHLYPIKSLQNKDRLNCTETIRYK